MTMKEQILTKNGLSSALYAVFSGRDFAAGTGAEETVISPLDKKTLASFNGSTKAQAEDLVNLAQAGFAQWRQTPVPTRGAFMRKIGDLIIANQRNLAELMTLEMGKPIDEAMAEVANSAETFYYAAGLARTIGGINVPSTRENVHLSEVWHPLGPTLIITAFNFPLALWAWNAALALVCGNSIIWKPAPQTPLMAIAVHHLLAQLVVQEKIPEGVLNCIIGDLENVAQPLVSHPDIPLVSATGSTRMGAAVAETVGKRLGRVILELGGNAPVILSESADLNVTIPTAFIAATGNAGQRCTALRRLFVHQKHYKTVCARLKSAYNSLPIGDVFQPGYRLCPLVDETAFHMVTKRVEQLKAQGTEVWQPDTPLPKEGYYVRPTLAFLPENAPQPQDECFGPLLYVQPYSDFEAALKLCNAVPQGLSSGIYTTDLREMHIFTGPNGVEAGMATVNDNTAGLEIGLGFGGIKNSGIGSEKGSDSWKNYMRRQSLSINYRMSAVEVPGIRFTG